MAWKYCYYQSLGEVVEEGQIGMGSRYYYCRCPTRRLRLLIVVGRGFGY